MYLSDVINFVSTKLNSCFIRQNITMNLSIEESIDDLPMLSHNQFPNVFLAVVIQPTEWINAFGHDFLWVPLFYSFLPLNTLVWFFPSLPHLSMTDFHGFCHFQTSPLFSVNVTLGVTCAKLFLL